MGSLPPQSATGSFEGGFRCGRCMHGWVGVRCPLVHHVHIIFRMPPLSVCDPGWMEDTTEGSAPARVDRKSARCVARSRRLHGMLLFWSS